MLDKTKAREIATAYSREVADVLNPDKIVLFGSFVDGNPNSESDIDVAVFISGLNDDDWYNARIQLQDLRWNKTYLDIEPHLLDENYDKSGFVKHVLETGELIYQS